MALPSGDSAADPSPPSPLESVPNPNPTAERTIRSGRRLSDAEALMWMVERDPVLRSSFVSITLLDRPPDMDRFRRRMAAAAHRIRRLRQRVVNPPGMIGTPQWADDPSFDIDYHVRHLALPEPGTQRQLLDLAAVQYQDAFDVARPLWQFTVVDGLEGGKAALLGKMHHTISDGVGAIRLSAMFVDLERDPAEADADPEAEEGAGRHDTVPSGGLSLLDTVGEAATEALRVPLGMGRQTLSNVLGAATHPWSIPHDAGQALGAARTALSQLLVTQPARSPLWAGKRSMGRRFEIFSLDMETARAAAHTMGGTLNDLYVAGVVGGAGQYHRAHGVTVESLRASIPVSTRTDRSAGGNSFVPARVLLPADIEDPAALFSAVHVRLTVLKSQRSGGFVDALAGLATSLPASLVVRMAQSQVGTVDFAASNVRGAPFELFIAGARILGNYPLGPTAGTAFNATLLTYRTQMDVGVNIDTEAVPDAEVLSACLIEGIEGMIAAGS
jgi:diacylglycerol O-acyltransferase